MKPTSKIYIDIDSLFDIRQAVLLSHLPEETVLDYIASDDYNFRSTDTFNILNHQQYLSTLNTRHPSLITRSTITYLLTVLKSKIFNLEKRNVFYNEVKLPEILLNTSPYTLPEPIVSAIQNALFLKLESKIHITPITIPIHLLTPYYINNSDISACFIYDFSKWMEIHSPSLESTPIRDTLLYFPSISAKEPTDEESKEITDLGFRDAFSYMEFITSGVAPIRFLPTLFYSNIVVALAELDRLSPELKSFSLDSLKKE